MYFCVHTHAVTSIQLHYLSWMRHGLKEQGVRGSVPSCGKCVSDEGKRNSSSYSVVGRSESSCELLEDYPSRPDHLLQFYT